MQEALRLVRSDLGPGAAVLHTRETPLGRLLRWLPGMRRIEVTASNDVVVPHRYPPPTDGHDEADSPLGHAEQAPPAGDLARKINELQAMVEDLCRRSRGNSAPDLPETLFGLYAELIDCEMPEDVARELMERVRSEAPPHEIDDIAALRTRVVQIIEREIGVQPPISLATGRCRVIALVGPTGVGKTTTIAKLAANFRLREKWNVGLITVDTYRIAAVEQLRTYADIIDLPMQVVSTPREMREAVDRMAHLDLVLLDTAGRSPRDEVKIRELRALSVRSAGRRSPPGSFQRRQRCQPDQYRRAIRRSRHHRADSDQAGRGQRAGASAAGSARARLPLSYLTNGQNVPDDIETAQPRRVAQVVLNAGARS